LQHHAGVGFVRVNGAHDRAHAFEDAVGGGVIGCPAVVDARHQHEILGREIGAIEFAKAACARRGDAEGYVRSGRPKCPD